jgi:ferredoxin
MNTGPRARGGYDIALTEVLDGEHRFVAESGSERGRELISKLEAAQASDVDVAAADAAVENAASHMGRSMDTEGIRDLLQRNYENARWDDVALRCLSCTNCTMVCPTCFCSTIEDVPDLSMENADRVRRWDSCFTDDFSYIHGGNMRPSVSSRYRHWITHKLSTWYDQFGTSGCVGCGRCITWCPPGIDITEEVRAIRASEEASS